MKYELERSILRDNPSLSCLARAYGVALRQHLYYECHNIRDAFLKLYPKCDFRKFIRASHSLVSSRWDKQHRLKERIQRMLGEGNTTFLTLTWNDSALASNKSSTRKAFVRQALNATTRYYIANIDFGKTTSREHYHAVCLELDCEEIRKIWKPFGYIKIERVIPSTEGSLALYIDKLCNHALKESAGWQRLMYCRQRKLPPNKKEPPHEVPPPQGVPRVCEG